MHPNSTWNNIPIVPAFEDYVYMMFDLCDGIPIKCIVFPMMGEIDNAVAFNESSGGRLIIYDRRLSEKIGYFGAQSIIAHELGHHYCQHLEGSRHISPHEAELEADRFMGFAMKKAGVSFSDFSDTLRALGVDQKSSSHPDLVSRTRAVLDGFEANSVGEICVGQLLD